MKLYGYWRSTASYRVRMALALKQIAYENCPIDLVKGAHLDASFQSKNPQRLVPVLELNDGTLLSQSQAILDYLDAAYPETPLLPQAPVERAKAMALAANIACEIHPLGNLRVQKYVGQTYGVGKEGGQAWAAHWIALGFAPLEEMVAKRKTPFLFGDTPGYCECFITPQISNAVRFGVDMSPFPNLQAIDADTRAWPGLAETAPDAQIDAPQRAG